MSQNNFPDTILCFDIETIPDAKLLRRTKFVDYSGLSIEEYANDEIVIQMALNYQEQQTAKEGKAGSSFLPTIYHQVVAISAVWYQKKSAGNISFSVKSIGTEESSEKELIDLFFKTIDKFQPQLVSWNGQGFDLPVLQHRALAHHITAPIFNKHSDDFKWDNYFSRYHFRHTDVMDRLAMYGKCTSSLDRMAKLCNYPGKLELDGSGVYERYLQGKSGLKAIRDYCETDVLNTYLVFLNHQLFAGLLNQVMWQEEVERVHDYLMEHSENKPHFEQFIDAWDSYL